jgi:superfamily II DNA/RNA helicase
MKLHICLKRWYRLQSPYQRLSRHRMLVTSQSPTPSSILTGEQTGKSTIDREAFIFGDKPSFVSCGLSPQLLSALSSAGKSIPTVIQAKSFPAIEGGQNVVIGAETGSGKTLAYLIPIIDGILKKDVETSDQEVTVRSYPSAIIMVPNKELCSQVCRMANEILCHFPSPHNVSIGKIFY